jgi:hypothetical protein
MITKISKQNTKKWTLQSKNDKNEVQGKKNSRLMQVTLKHKR